VTKILINDRRIYPDASFFKAVKEICTANRENGFTREHEQKMYDLLIPRPAIVDKFSSDKVLDSADGGWRRCRLFWGFRMIFRGQLESRETHMVSTFLCTKVLLVAK